MALNHSKCSPIFIVIFLLVSHSRCDDNTVYNSECANNSLITCQSIKIFKKMARQFLENQSKDVVIATGIHLVQTENPEPRSTLDGSPNGSLYGSLEKFLLNHEIRIKMPEIFPIEKIKKSLNIVFEEISQRSLETGRKKDKGAGMYLALALATAKILATIGFGAVGALAMKALMVSSLALMLSALLGLKKMSSGHESAPQVIYAGHGGHEGHHRKRRYLPDDNTPLPYRAWNPLK